MSLFQRLSCTLLYVHVAGTMDSVLVKEVSTFQESRLEGFYCMHVHACTLYMCMSVYINFYGYMMVKCNVLVLDQNISQRLVLRCIAFWLRCVEHLDSSILSLYYITFLHRDTKIREKLYYRVL